MEDFLNTPMLLRHAVSFGIYLFASTAACIIQMLLEFNTTDTSITIDSVASSLDYLLQFGAQILLCQIIWVLGKKEERKQETVDLITQVFVY